MYKKYSRLYQDGIEDGIKQVAKRMKQNKQTTEQISKMTGLTKEKIKKL